MKLREVKIKNFRCLVDVTIPVDDTTVVIGENNSGKTAFLDAIRIALPRFVGARETLFDEYDYHMCKAGDSPQTCEGIVIELWFREDQPDEWPDSLIQALSDIVQTDPINDLDCIGLRLSSKHDAAAGEIVTKWEFLAMDGQTLEGRGARRVNLTTFISYIRLFYLSAFREADNEFTPRSQYWGRILRDLKISEEQRKTLSEELEKLNAELLKADPRLEEVMTSLGEMQTIMPLGGDQSTSVQALPIKPWDLMSKSQVVMRTSGSEIDIPLSRYGQGIQSLAVLFLFQSYLKVLLKPSFRPETEAILELEEPEAHLHPQATRTLGANLDKVSGQKIISSHSPYFIQEIPFEKIRMFRRDGPLSRVVHIKRHFTTTVPDVAGLQEFCAHNSAKFSYHTGTLTLSLHGRMEQREYRALLTLYSTQTDIHAKLRQLKDESKSYLSDDDLTNLDTFAKRIRGEILFARAWLLCEGQCEYLLMRFFAELMNKPFDSCGVSVIDFQNNGSPDAFVGLARAFDIPWIIVCDNDSGKDAFLKQVKDRGFTDEECSKLFRPLPGENMKLEKFLFRNGFDKEYRQILDERKVHLSNSEGTEEYENELISSICANKVGSSITLIEKLRATGADESRIPAFLSTVINDIVDEATI